MIKNLRERLIGVSGSISGTASILGSWQICHSVCLGLIAILGIIGITITWMPLEFLTTVVIPLWTVAIALLLITIFFYIKKKCISKNLIIINSGLITAGTPFYAIQNFKYLFWIIGGILFVLGIILFIKEKIERRRDCHAKTK